MTMTLVESKTLATAAAQIEFTSIPQDATDLYLSISTRTTSNISGEQWAFGEFGFNADGQGVNQSARFLFGNNSSSGSFSVPTRFYSSSSASTSNTFGSSSLYITNYTGSTQKSLSVDSVSEDNSVNGGFLLICAGLWTGTAAITTIKLFPRSGVGDFAIGSTVSLYKITKGSSGGVTVS
jgi:hypothetical protein